MSSFNSSGACKSPYRYSNVFGKGILDVVSGTLIARFPGYGTHAHIDMEMGDLVARRLNDWEDNAFSAEQGRYYVKTWRGIDHEDPHGDMTDFVGVLDSQHEDPLLGIMFHIGLPARGKTRMAMIHVAGAIARILNHVGYEWVVCKIV